MKRLWLWATGILLLSGGCGAPEHAASSAQLASSPSRIAQVFNDGQKIVIIGQTNGQSQLSLVIGQLHWTAKGSRPDEFTASLEPSSEAPRGQSPARKGFVFNVGDSRFYVAEGSAPAGQLVLRKNSRIARQGDDFVVADMLQKDGQKIPVVVRLQAKT